MGLAAHLHKTNTSLHSRGLTNLFKMNGQGDNDGSKVNRQLYKNSALAGSSAEEDVVVDLDALYNAKDPNLAVIHEKPEHRQMIFLKAQGYSNREIARATGYTDAWVSQVMRQPWARKRVVEEIQNAGRNGVEAILEASVEDSIWKVIELRDTAEKQETQLAAARDILDRYLGKATQRVESLNKNMNMNVDLVELDSKIRELEEEEKRLMGSL